MAEETPLILQYKSVKQNYQNEVLFFRLGDFYEMFNEDAVEVSRLLNLTLTHRQDMPMCGIPYHAAKVYIARLLRFGKKIAICEQVGEIPKGGKGITERKVIEVITPGTAVESEYLDGGVNNFLGSIYIKDFDAAVAFIDVTTGEFKATHFPVKQIADQLPKELGRFLPKELILSDQLKNNMQVQNAISTVPNLSVSYYPSWHFNSDVCYKKLLAQFKTQNLRSFSLDENSVEVPPAGFLLDYLSKTTNACSDHISSIQIYSDNQFVIIDDSSRRNLEINSNLRDGSTNFTLLECVNFTQTAMGSRMIRQWLNFPLTNLELIHKRQNNVELFVSDRELLNKTRENLDGILDVERLAGRISMDRAHAKDLQALKISLKKWEDAKSTLSSTPLKFQDSSVAVKIINLINDSILDDPATSLTDGGMIKNGWSQELDHWRNVQQNFNQILEEYISKEREETGIQNLKVKSSGNMGYFIEVSKGKITKVPEHFIMRRALVNADRYTTERLQELEGELNIAATKILELERDLFIEIRNQLKEFVPYLLTTSKEIASLDVTVSFGYAAIKNKWVKPVIDDSLNFKITEGRHPVVEAHLPTGEFVPNDLDLNDKFFALITGPNMAGKSTFLRQNALICLLAQTGSFVPAAQAIIGVCDRIFCRVGASDNLARGESTFLVEMTETAHILRSATEHSLVIMDEVGRGTSTEDGLSIAWSISEYLLGKLKCKTLFATHYHELTRMVHEKLKMLCMQVAQEGNDVVFLRKVIDGSSENSFGIHVARLAGVPESVVQRAQVILEQIQNQKSEGPSANIQVQEVIEEKKPITARPGALFSDEEMILDEILSTDPDNMTPIKALELVARWKKNLSGQ